jgi:hypothetical protein
MTKFSCKKNPNFIFNRKRKKEKENKKNKTFHELTYHKIKEIVF